MPSELQNAIPQAYHFDFKLLSAQDLVLPMAALQKAARDRGYDSRLERNAVKVNVNGGSVLLQSDSTLVFSGEYTGQVTKSYVQNVLEEMKRVATLAKSVSDLSYIELRVLTNRDPNTFSPDEWTGLREGVSEVRRAVDHIVVQREGSFDEYYPF